MKRLSLCLLLALALLATGALPGTDAAFLASRAEGFSGDLRPGETVSADGLFSARATAFDFGDRLGYYRQGATEPGGSGDYYLSGDDALYALLKMDIDNTSASPADYLEGCVVKAYCDGMAYGGWAFQQNYANGISADLAYGEDSERQNTAWVINAADGFPIEPGQRGHYVFGCTLPVDVARGGSALMLAVTVQGAQLSYEIRAQAVEPTPEPTREAAPTPVPANVDLSSLSKGDKGDRVSGLQRILIQLGYLSGGADGDFGNKTLAAVQAAQVMTGLEATGVADADFLTRLYAGEIPDAAGRAASLTPQVIGYSATSEHRDKYGSYPVSAAFDGNTNTHWSESAPGYGIGEGITFTVATFGRTSFMLDIRAGNHRAKRNYNNNGRPKDITLIVDGVTSHYTLRDAMGIQSVEISGYGEKPFVEIGLFIESAYPGQKWQDTCICELQPR